MQGRLCVEEDGWGIGVENGLEKWEEASIFFWAAKKTKIQQPDFSSKKTSFLVGG